MYVRDVYGEPGTPAAREKRPAKANATTSLIGRVGISLVNTPGWWEPNVACHITEKISMKKVALTTAPARRG